MSTLRSVCHTRINELCAKEERVTQSENVDMRSLPPCKKSLMQHICKFNYQVAIWKKANIADPEIPDHVGHGWHVIDGKMEPLWFDGDVLPQQRTDIAEGSPTDSGNSDDDSDLDELLRDMSYNINSESDEDGTLSMHIKC